MNPLRHLPSVNALLELPALQSLAEQHPRQALVEAIRSELEQVRKSLSAGAALDGHSDPAVLAQRIADRLHAELRPRLRSVINATGIVLHTNLGRAPMAEPAAQAAYEAAHGYLNLEMDLETGKRSSRQDAIRDWVCKLTGAEAATAVNNNAAATVIVLRALCRGKEVIISRGQLIEIGGSFRIPEIMSVSGATLREVGTTNITRLADYENAIGPNTAALMQVHTSNYRISGFTKAATLDELVALGRKYQVPVLDDIGSGAMLDFARFGFAGEPIAKESIAAGADLVLFSGDKLLGGPQAGIIAGKKEWISKIEKDPLMRAFRLDKMTLAALEATLRLYLDEEKALSSVPALNMLHTSLEELRRKAEMLAERLLQIPGIEAALANEDIAYVGGGSLPDQQMKTWSVRVTVERVSPTELARRLRVGRPAVLGRLEDGKLVLDVRTIFTRQIEPLLAAVQAALAEPMS